MRLTKFNFTTKVYELVDSVNVDECIKKLGLLEDIEDKVGLDLSTALAEALVYPKNYYYATINDTDYMLETTNFIYSDGKLYTKHCLYKDPGNNTWTLVYENCLHSFIENYTKANAKKEILKILSYFNNKEIE